MLKLADYKAYCLDKELSPNTIKNYLTTLRQFDRFLQQKNISSINKEATIAYKQSILDQKYSLKTINQKIVILNVYLNWLNRPDLRIKMLKQQSEIHRISINEKEYRRLLHHSEGETQLFIL
ncbi:site-specific integrase, partial [Lacticaseibacillus paracasei]